MYYVSYNLYSCGKWLFLLYVAIYKQLSWLIKCYFLFFSPTIVWMIELSSVDDELDASGTEGEADGVSKVTKQLDKQVIEEKEEDGEEG